MAWGRQDRDRSSTSTIPIRKAAATNKKPIASVVERVRASRRTAFAVLVLTPGGRTLPLWAAVIPGPAGPG